MQPEITSLPLRSLAGLCLVLFALASQADVPEELAENWYRTEILIFVRENVDSRLAEQWDPLPALEYPVQHRYLLDPAAADRRLEESQSYASAIDSRGVQTLMVPAPIEEVLDHSRPDALTTPVNTLDVLIPADSEDGSDADTSLVGELSPVTGTPLELSDDPNTPLLDPNSPALDLESPVIALPYELLDNDQLGFRSQARSLRRQGHRVVFHGSWWAMLDEAEQTPSLIIDRSGDMDSLDWPALQGSLQVYRSRYLHIVLDLWLNTQGEYLPEGWQIAPPPLPTPSLEAQTLGGDKINPWSPALSINELLGETTMPNPSDPALALDSSLKPAIAATQEEQSLAQYPWRHAIVHRQSRRMRSGEVHYLDHPVIGVIVKVTPMSEDELPLMEPAEREFRQRHALPIELLPENTDSKVEP